MGVAMIESLCKPTNQPSVERKKKSLFISNENKFPISGCDRHTRQIRLCPQFWKQTEIGRKRNLYYSVLLSYALKGRKRNLYYSVLLSYALNYYYQYYYPTHWKKKNKSLAVTTSKSNCHFGLENGSNRKGKLSAENKNWVAFPKVE